MLELGPAESSAPLSDEFNPPPPALEVSELASITPHGFYFRLF